MATRQFSFLQVKGFGDFTIAANELRLVEPQLIKSCSLLIAPHLVDLAKLLAPPCDLNVLPIEEAGVPALYDIRKSGLLRGIRSAFFMRQLLGREDRDAVLVMPGSSTRERFIGGRRSFLSIPKSDNIYKAYRQFFEKELGAYQLVGGANSFVTNIRNRVVICPYSRMPEKNIPISLIGNLADICIDSGFKPEILLLEGETFTHTIEGLSVRKVPRSFPELAFAISKYSCVISADSLPGHLAEYYKIPVFVVKKSVNVYWLPLSAYAAQYWGLFDEYCSLKFGLHQFFNKVRNE